MANRTVRLVMTLLVFYYVGNAAREYARENDMNLAITQFGIGGAASYFTWKASAEFM